MPPLQSKMKLGRHECRPPLFSNAVLFAQIELHSLRQRLRRHKKRARTMRPHVKRPCMRPTLNGVCNAALHLVVFVNAEKTFEDELVYVQSIGLDFHVARKWIAEHQYQKQVQRNQRR